MSTAVTQSEQEGKGLKSGAVGLFGSVVIGMASTAPAYSLAASLGFIVASGGSLLSGVKAPGILLLAFVPMFLIAIAYQELNKAEADCGTTFTWASRAFGPIAGWLGGWGIIAADVIVMANLAQIAGSYSFTFAGTALQTFGMTDTSAISNLSSDVLWSTVAGLIWIALMTWIAYRGIEVSARLQYGLLGIEVVVLIIFAITALTQVYSGNAPWVGGPDSFYPNIDWFNPFNLDFSTVIAPAILTAIFIYWGWDTTVAINEETKDPGKTPGRAAVISTVLLLVTYSLVSVAAVAFAGTDTTGIGLGNKDNASDVFNAIGPTLFGDSALGHIMMLLLAASILTSSAASTQTTILPTARTALSMGVFKAIPERFANVHHKFLTPTWATIGMGVISAAFYLLFTLISTNLLAALVGSIGLMIAFYYGLTGFACVWYYRKTLLSDVRSFFMRGLLPLLGGLMLFAVMIYGLVSFAAPDWLTDANDENVTIFNIGAVAVVGVGAMLLGVVLMVVWWIMKPDFFQGKTLSRRTHLLVLDREGREAAFGLPDSGDEAEIIAPDLSNLPTGATAVDLETGERITRSESRKSD